MLRSRKKYQVISYVNTEPAKIVEEYDDKRRAWDHALLLMEGTNSLHWYDVVPVEVTVH